jgi:hypothetical protein
VSLSGNFSWEIKIPLISNRFIVGNVVKGLSLALLLFFIIIGSILGFSGGWKGVGQALIACLCAGCFMGIVSVFTLAVFLGNQYLLEFQVSEDGVTMKSKSERAHFAHRLALILGALGRNPAAAGAGAVGIAGETSHIPWNRIKSIKLYPTERAIRLKRNFLETIYVYCSPENFEETAAVIAERTAAHKGQPDRVREIPQAISAGSVQTAREISVKPVSVSCPQCKTTGSSRRADDAARELKSIPEKNDPTDKELEEEIKRAEILEALEKPQAPALFSFSRWALIMFIPLVNVVAIFFSPLLRGLKLFMSAVNLVFIGSIIWVAGFSKNYHDTKDLPLLIGFFTCVLYWICLAYSWKVAKAGSEEKKNAWKIKLSRWEHLLYCDTCKIVFWDDDQGPSAPVGATEAFLAGAVGAEIGEREGKAPLWLWVLLALVCAGGVAFFLAFVEPSHAPEKKQLTPQEQALVFSDIQEDNIKLSESGDSQEPLLSQP